MKIPSPRPRKKARLEIIPLIDVIFFLLATFMIVSLSMAKVNGVPVNLPPAVTGSALDKDGIVITLTHEGYIFFDKEKIPPEHLRARVEKLKAERPNAKISIGGDEKALWGLSVRVLDELRQAGFTKIAIETKSSYAQ
jgi:biopolymer transport protein ExbD